MDKKISAFLVGNLVGLTILVGGVLLTLPKKMKETEMIEKQKLEREKQSAKQAVVAGTGTIVAANPDQDSKTQTVKAKELAPYVVATRYISRGEKILASDVSLEQLLREKNPDALSNLDGVIGKTTTAEIKQGSTISSKVLK